MWWEGKGREREGWEVGCEKGLRQKKDGGQIEGGIMMGDEREKDGRCGEVKKRGNGRKRRGEREKAW